MLRRDSRLIPIPFALGSFHPAQFCLDKRVDVAVHDILHIAGFCASAVVLHHLVRLENVRANLISPRDVAFLRILPVDLGALFVLLDFVKLRFQHFHRELAIAPLPPLRNVSISRSAGLTSIGAVSAISGTTSTLANEVWRRLFASNGEIRTSRCTPRSVWRCPYAYSPVTNRVTDLMPTSSPCCMSTV